MIEFLYIAYFSTRFVLNKFIKECVAWLYVHGHFVFVLVAFSNGTLRLEGSEVDYEGRLEVYYLGQWGTVCSHGFDSRDAKVACRSLGFGLVTVQLFVFTAVCYCITSCAISCQTLLQNDIKVYSFGDHN